MRYFLKLFGRSGTILSWFKKGGAIASKATKAAGGTSKTATWLRRGWYGVDAAITGAFVYDYFRGDKGVGGSEAWSGTRNLDQIDGPDAVNGLLSLILNKISIAAISVDYPDVQSVQSALTGAANLFLMSDSDNKHLTGIILLATCDYLDSSPSSNSGSASSIKEMKETLLDIIDQSQDKKAKGGLSEMSDSEKKALKSALDEMLDSIDEANSEDPATLRMLDYLTFVLNFIQGNLGSDIAQSVEAARRNPKLVLNNPALAAEIGDTGNSIWEHFDFLGLGYSSSSISKKGGE